MNFSSDSSENEDMEIVSEKIREIAKNLSLNLLPQKSKQKYVATYNSFKKWRKENGSNSFCEDVMLAYFDEMSKSYAPSSLWAIYSMLRSTINTFDQIDIGSYKKLTYLLKKKSKGFQSKKSKVFTKEDISKFLNDAPNEIFLCMKTVLIFGIAGALRRQEFVNLKVNDVIESDNNTLIVKILITKNKIPRSFIINEDLYKICKEYMQMRPQPCSTDRFFLKYFNGKCTQQPMGINTFGSMPKAVATYLNLDGPQLYTGHSFRRTSATLLIDAGADVTALKRHGGWQSTSVAEGYVAESLQNKRKISEQITSGIVLNKQSKTGNVTNNSKLAIDAWGSSANALSQPKTDQNSLASRNVCSTSSRMQSPDIRTRENCIVKTTSDKVSENALIFKSPVFYDPDLGLYVLVE